MSQPQWSPVDEGTADLLSVLADPHPIIGADASQLFLDACRRDAMAHDGLVSVNRVRVLMADRDLEPHRYSSFWSAFTGRGKPMVKALAADGSQMWEICAGSPSGNDGRLQPTRRWVG